MCGVDEGNFSTFESVDLPVSGRFSEGRIEDSRSAAFIMGSFGAGLEQVYSLIKSHSQIIRRDMKVTISNEGDVLVAVLEDGTTIQETDAISLASRLAAAGVRSDQVVAIDWHEDVDRAPSGGQRIAIYQYLRQHSEPDRQ